VWQISCGGRVRTNPVTGMLFYLLRLHDAPEECALEYMHGSAGVCMHASISVCVRVRACVRSFVRACILQVKHHALRPEVLGQILRTTKRDTEDTCENGSTQLYIYIYIYIILVRGWGSAPQVFGIVVTLLCFFSIYLWATRCNQV
jgi:hypothetical protein